MHGRDYQFTVTLQARNEFYNLFYYYWYTVLNGSDRPWRGRSVETA